MRPISGRSRRRWIPSSRGRRTCTSAPLTDPKHADLPPVPPVLRVRRLSTGGTGGRKGIRRSYVRSQKRAHVYPALLPRLPALSNAPDADAALGVGTRTPARASRRCASTFRRASQRTPRPAGPLALTRGCEAISDRVQLTAAKGMRQASVWFIISLSRKG